MTVALWVCVVCLFVWNVTQAWYLMVLHETLAQHKKIIEAMREETEDEYFEGYEPTGLKRGD